MTEIQSPQPEALRLADCMHEMEKHHLQVAHDTDMRPEATLQWELSIQCSQASAELRRLHSVNAELVHDLKCAHARIAAERNGFQAPEGGDSAAFEAWFQERKQRTWRESGHDFGRGETAPVNWSEGLKGWLLEGWQARAALAAQPEWSCPETGRTCTAEDCGRECFQGAAEGDEMLEPLIYAAMMHNGKPKTLAEFERAAANVADMLQRRAAVTHAKPVASIYISADGSREFDDWRVDLPPGNHQLFTAPRSAQPQPEQLPHPGTPEAEEMIDKLLAEYNRPANMKNAARAGYMAARRLLQNARQPLPATDDAEPNVQPKGITSVCHMECDACLDAGKCAFPGKPAEPVRYPHPDEDDAVTLWAEIHRLRAAVQGPDGYATWQDAATAERVRRVAAEKALAACPSPAPAPSAARLTQDGKLHVTAWQCHGCGHRGIDDGDDAAEACSDCNWRGPCPDEDVCPGCGREGTMVSACPKCGDRYYIKAEADIVIPTAAQAPAVAPGGTT